MTVTGDGFVNAFDAANPSYAFIESYPTSSGPNIYRSTSGGGVGSVSTLPKTGIGSGASSFPFKTEFALVPGGSTSYLVTGSTHLYRANARAGTVSWTLFSTNLAGTGVLSALGTPAAARSTPASRTAASSAPATCWPARSPGAR